MSFFEPSEVTPEEVRVFHEQSDLDTKHNAQHHTLGKRDYQASPGNHKHEGIYSERLMKGITISGSKGGNAALADLITKLSVALGFTDETT